MFSQLEWTRKKCYCCHRQTVRPDLTKFLHFGKNSKILLQFFSFIWYLEKVRTHFGKVLMRLGKLAFLKIKNLTIWSHWCVKANFYLPSSKFCLCFVLMGKKLKKDFLKLFLQLAWHFPPVLIVLFTRPCRWKAWSSLVEGD